jgi:hypothetical protein
LQDLPVLVDGGEADAASPEALQEEFRLDEVMETEVKQLMSREQRMKQVRCAWRLAKAQPGGSQRPRLAARAGCRRQRHCGMCGSG